MTGLGFLFYNFSAGIGRTGTYIALDALYKSGKDTGKINVAEYVKAMRSNRMNMIQTYVGFSLFSFILTTILNIAIRDFILYFTSTVYFINSHNSRSLKH